MDRKEDNCWNVSDIVDYKDNRGPYVVLVLANR